MVNGNGNCQPTFAPPCIPHYTAVQTIGAEALLLTPRSKTMHSVTGVHALGHVHVRPYPDTVHIMSDLFFTDHWSGNCCLLPWIPSAGHHDHDQTPLGKNQYADLFCVPTSQQRRGI